MKFINKIARIINLNYHVYCMNIQIREKKQKTLLSVLYYPISITINLQNRLISKVLFCFIYIFRILLFNKCLMYMYDICFIVNVKSMGYKYRLYEEINNIKYILNILLEVGRILCSRWGLSILLSTTVLLVHSKSIYQGIFI